MTTIQNPGQPPTDAQGGRAMSRLRQMLRQIREEQVRLRERLARVRPPEDRTGATRPRDRAD